MEFERRELVVCEGKGNKDRVTVLPENLLAPLREQLERARVLQAGYDIRIVQELLGHKDVRA